MELPAIDLAAPDFVNGNHVGVIECRSRFRFLHEPLQAAGVRDEIRRENLQRHVPAERAIDGVVDRAHPARPEEGEDAIASDQLAGEIKSIRHGADRHCRS